MHPIAGVPLVILLSFIICVRAQANFGITSYWIDKSCPQDVGRAIDETREGASRIINRMITQEDDKYMQFLQENIARFSVIKDQDRDVVWGRFRLALGKIRKEKFIETGTRESAHVRFYCDGDKRWKLRADDPNPDGKLNSKEPLEKRVFVDPENYLEAKGKRIGGMQKLLNPNKVVLAASYYASKNGGTMPNAPAQENSERMTITLQKDLLDRKLWTYQQCVDGKFPPELWPNFKILDAIVSHVITHELMHHPRIANIDTADAHEGNDGIVRSGYHWSGVRSLTVGMDGIPQSMRNPDSFAYWVGMGRMWDNQYQASQDENDLLMGKFIKDDKIPKNPYDDGSNPSGPSPSKVKSSKLRRSAWRKSML